MALPAALPQIVLSASRAAPSQTTLLALPEELYGTISSFLDEESLVKYGMVRKTFTKYRTEYEKTLTNIDIVNIEKYAKDNRVLILYLLKSDDIYLWNTGLLVACNNGNMIAVKIISEHAGYWNCGLRGRLFGRAYGDSEVYDREGSH